MSSCPEAHVWIRTVRIPLTLQLPILWLLQTHVFFKKAGRAGPLHRVRFPFQGECLLFALGKLLLLRWSASWHGLWSIRGSICNSRANIDQNSQEKPQQTMYYKIPILVTESQVSTQLSSQDLCSPSPSSPAIKFASLSLRKPGRPR